jgi:predicted fused transcriptional regulator/phosphomethylpyrimidine kinase
VTTEKELAEGVRHLSKKAHALRQALRQEFPNEKHLMRYIDKITNESRKLHSCLNIRAELKVGEPAIESDWDTFVSSVDHKGRPTSVQMKLGGLYHAEARS